MTVAQKLITTLTYMVCFKYKGTTWWIWLGPTNTKITSQEMKMLSPENLMFCDSNVIKQVKYNILSQFDECESHDFGSTQRNVFYSTGYKFRLGNTFILILVLCNHLIPNLCSWQSKQLKCHWLNCINLWDGHWQRVCIWIQINIIIINCARVLAVLEDLVLMPVHTKPEDSVKELDELYDVFQDVKKKWKTDVKHNALNILYFKQWDTRSCALLFL